MLITWTALALTFLGIGNATVLQLIDVNKKLTSSAEIFITRMVAYIVSPIVFFIFKGFGVYCAIKALPLWVEFIRALQ